MRPEQLLGQMLIIKNRPKIDSAAQSLDPGSLRKTEEISLETDRFLGNP